MLSVLWRAVEHRTLRRENAALKRLVCGEAGAATLVATSSGMRTLLTRVERVAPRQYGQRHKPSLDVDRGLKEPS